MAASLLGPLIPSEVKEAEEKWRKKLLKGLDEPENSLDSDGEGVRPVGSPATSQQDPEPVPTVQKDLSTKKQSRDNSDAEEETEEDTMDLELALERKKVGCCFSVQLLQQLYFKINCKCYCHCDVTSTCCLILRLSYGLWRRVMGAQEAPVLVLRRAKKPLGPVLLK